MFNRLIHADWSVDPRKRWQATAVRRNRSWDVLHPQPVGSVSVLLDDAFRQENSGSTLVGFDFPIGIPDAYGCKTNFAGFREALAHFGTGEWANFFDVASHPEEVSFKRPFYPRGCQKGVSRRTLVSKLEILEFNDLLRVCERKTPERRAACSLFWTLGGNQVGRAAISGWNEAIKPAIERGAALWPFDGSLSDLSMSASVVLVETYPAEAYRMFNASFHSKESKRQQRDRASKSSAILNWADKHSVHLSDAVETSVRNGFGEKSTGEDAFDAFSGLLKMIEVVEGRRQEATVGLERALKWEGWILGR